MSEIISETWLQEHLPQGWTYDCRFEPEPAFLIYASEGGAAPRYGPFVLPLVLLHNPAATEATMTRLSDHGHAWEQRARRAEATLREEGIEHAPDCKPEHLTEPDSEGIRDCTNCGLWESPAPLIAEWENRLGRAITEACKLADMPVPQFNANAASLALRNGIQQLENALIYVRSGIPE